MRVIAGEFKGRRLEGPDNDYIRPTTDKVKEAMFSIIGGKILDSKCVDLFSGTGNIGLEAISRGAQKCYFCDNSGKAMGIIKRNISYCKADEQAEIMAGDFRRSLEKIRDTGDKIDFFFLDPPYNAGYYDKAMEIIAAGEILTFDGMIVAEHPRELLLPNNIAGLEMIKERRYGRIVLSIYVRSEYACSI